MSRSRLKILSSALALWSLSSSVNAAPRSIAELAPVATIKLGETADWVAITPDAVWVASTGPFAVHRIDPNTNRLAATVQLAGEPCAGLAVGSGSLWVPMCTTPPSLAKVDLKTGQLVSTYPVGAAAPRGGIAYGAGSVWLIVKQMRRPGAGGVPGSGKILRTYGVPAGVPTTRSSAAARSLDLTRRRRGPDRHRCDDGGRSNRRHRPQSKVSHRRRGRHSRTAQSG